MIALCVAGVIGSAVFALVETAAFIGRDRRAAHGRLRTASSRTRSLS